MAQSTMILPFSIQSKFQDYFEGIVLDFCICIFKRLTDAVRGRVIIHHTCTRHATFINNTSYQTNHLSIIHLLDWTDDKTIFCRHIVIGLFPIPTKILFVFRQWVCSHSIYHGLHYYIQAERIFDIHPYAVLELKQLTSKEAAVKATPTPTTPVHP